MIAAVLAWLLAIPLTVVLSYLSLELACGLARFSPATLAATEGSIDTVVLIPAHNEETGIAQTVADLGQSAPSARVLVIADNCSDRTAKFARGAGAEVVERTDPDRRGKGFALAFGRQMLAETTPPRVVVILDADCRAELGTVERLARRAVMSPGPVQSANLLMAEYGAPPLVAISNFAVLIKNLVRARGLSRLSGGALLFGTGMAFAWELFVRLPLATASAVEDLDLGLGLARQGVSVTLDDGALVTSPAATAQDSRGQRSRWEHGFLQTAIASALPFLGRGLASSSRHLAALGAHMLVPPLALLMGITAVALIALGIVGLAWSIWLPFELVTAALAITLALLLAAWWREGRAVLPLAVLARAPLYVLWKLPIYAGFMRKRQVGWNRTPRRDDQR